MAKSAFISTLSLVRLKLTPYVARHPGKCAGLLVLVFFVVFQRGVLLLGDVWAEGHAIFLGSSTFQHWGVVTAPTTEGYLSILPIFFAKAYVSAGLPIGYVDYYFRAVAVCFTLAVVAFTAAPINRKLIKSDNIRILFGLVVALLLTHLSVFTYINIWYLGFLPLCLIGLNTDALSIRKQIAYTVYGSLIALSKPSILLAPFVIFRAYRTKEYLSNTLILLASLWQTHLLFSAGPEVNRHMYANFANALQALYLGGSVALLKMISIFPSNIFLIVAANIVIVSIFIVLFRTRHWMIASLVLFGYLFSIYSNLLAPGTITNFTAEAIYNNPYKLQRELLINMFLMLAVFLIAERVIIFIRTHRSSHKLFNGSLYLLLAAVFLRLYHPIDTTSSRVTIDIEPFRYGLDLHQPLCVPIAPAPNWSPGTSWFLQYRGGCTFVNFDKATDPMSFKQSLKTSVSFTAPGYEARELKTILVPLKTSSLENGQAILRERASGMLIISNVKASPDGLRYVAFNTAGLPPRTSYEFDMYSAHSFLYAGRFIDGSPIFYAYYIGLPQ